MIGYLDRQGKFIDVSSYDEHFRHEAYCTSINTCEEYLLDVLGYVKLTNVLPHDYIYTKFTAMSIQQVNFLFKNGYKVQEYDMPN